MDKVGVVSLGCAKNRVDTELMLGILRKRGYELTANEAEADILIVNTCGFIDPAKQESIDTLLSLAEYKKTGRLRLLVATGCLVQRYEKELLAELPEVDLLLGVNQYERLPEAIEQALRGQRTSYCADDRHILEGERVLTTPSYTAYVRIADGCDNRCAYCAIPLIRGGFRSRPMGSVLAEIRALAEQGVKEHVLIAQDTSRYGLDLYGRPMLAELLEQAAGIPGVAWLRVLYCSPMRWTTACSAPWLRTRTSAATSTCLCSTPTRRFSAACTAGRHGQGARVPRKGPRHGFTLRTTMIVGFPARRRSSLSA
jgi:ribosomal protein S12 methylthiotransferase